MGGPPPGDAVTVGLFPTKNGVHIFTTVSSPTTHGFHDTGIACNAGCTLGLTGDRSALTASVSGHAIANWPRYILRSPEPMVQLNAETSKPGDGIDARLRPERGLSRGKTLPAPTCAFTTQGIEITRESLGSLHYSGTYRPDAPTTYVSLVTGTRADSCEQLQ
jgi:hypothetical protein